jgi:hypothetical protein
MQGTLHTGVGPAAGLMREMRPANAAFVPGDERPAAPGIGTDTATGLAVGNVGRSDQLIPAQPEGHPRPRIAGRGGRLPAAAVSVQAHTVAMQCTELGGSPGAPAPRSCSLRCNISAECQNGTLYVYR